MDTHSEIRRIKWQRNLVGMAAVAIVAIGIAICLPSALERRKRLQLANDEVLAVQGEIKETQRLIVGVQEQIILTQAAIRTLTNERH